MALVCSEELSLPEDKARRLTIAVKGFMEERCLANYYGMKWISYDLLVTDHGYAISVTSNKEPNQGSRQTIRCYLVGFIAGWLSNEHYNSLRVGMKVLYKGEQYYIRELAGHVGLSQNIDGPKTLSVTADQVRPL